MRMGEPAAMAALGGVANKVVEAGAHNALQRRGAQCAGHDARVSAAVCGDAGVWGPQPCREHEAACCCARGSACPRPWQCFFLFPGAPPAGGREHLSKPHFWQGPSRARRKRAGATMCIATRRRRDATTGRVGPATPRATPGARKMDMCGDGEHNVFARLREQFHGLPLQGSSSDATFKKKKKRLFHHGCPTF